MQPSVPGRGRRHPKAGGGMNSRHAARMPRGAAFSRPVSSPLERSPMPNTTGPCPTDSTRSRRGEHALRRALRARARTPLSAGAGGVRRRTSRRATSKSSSPAAVGTPEREPRTLRRPTATARPTPTSARPPTSRRSRAASSTATPTATRATCSSRRTCRANATRFRAAHEYMHVIQGAYTSSLGLLTESTANWASELALPDIDPEDNNFNASGGTAGAAPVHPARLQLLRVHGQRRGAAAQLRLRLLAVELHVAAEPVVRDRGHGGPVAADGDRVPVRLSDRGRRPAASSRASSRRSPIARRWRPASRSTRATCGCRSAGRRPARCRPLRCRRSTRTGACHSTRWSTARRPAAETWGTRAPSAASWTASPSATSACATTGT